MLGINSFICYFVLSFSRPLICHVFRFVHSPFLTSTSWRKTRFSSVQTHDDVNRKWQTSRKKA